MSSWGPEQEMWIGLLGKIEAHEGHSGLDYLYSRDLNMSWDLNMT